MGFLARGTRTFSIRPATRDDLKAIVGIYNWAVNQTFATIDSEPLGTEDRQPGGRRTENGQS